MAKSRYVVSAGLIAGALVLVPISPAFAGGPHWSHGPSHGPVWHSGGGWQVVAMAGMAVAVTGTAASGGQVRLQPRWSVPQPP